jgi:hypothetical protein
MGSGGGAYREKFPKGSRVRILNLEHLERFAREWTLHNPLQNEQLAFADQATVVETVGFYHGGDTLYELRGVPGLWHEECLQLSEL